MPPQLHERWSIYSSCQARFLVMILSLILILIPAPRTDATVQQMHRQNDTRLARPHRSLRNGTGTPFSPIGSTWLPGGPYGIDTSVNSIGSTWLGCLRAEADPASAGAPVGQVTRRCLWN